MDKENSKVNALDENPYAIASIYYYLQAIDDNGTLINEIKYAAFSEIPKGSGKMKDRPETLTKALLYMRKEILDKGYSLDELNLSISRSPSPSGIFVINSNSNIVTEGVDNSGAGDCTRTFCEAK